MSQASRPHDPQKVIADLRDHLARHDKPIAFLFGAGTSCSVMVPHPADENKLVPFIPAVAQLTLRCKSDVEALGANFAAAWAAIEAQCVENGAGANIESLLSCLRMMLRAIGSTDRLAGLNRKELAALEQSIRKTIVRVVTPDIKNLPSDFPHRGLARWIGRTSRKIPIEIFTVNYDILLEHALESERVSYFDGFVGSYHPYFYPESLRHADCAPGPSWTRLWKLHGSVTWSRLKYDGKSRIVRGEVDATGEMILPSFEKYDESRLQPYSAFTDRLARFLELDDALLITSGFNFGDEHINNLIFSALESKPRTHVCAIQFEEPSEESDLARRSLRSANAIVLGPRTGTIRGQRAEWVAEEPPAFIADLFEIEAVNVVGDGGAEEKKVGEMRMGDFAKLCRFLEAMTPD